jgi:hypothetical protein
MRAVRRYSTMCMPRPLVRIKWCPYCKAFDFMRETHFGGWRCAECWQVTS